MKDSIISLADKVWSGIVQSNYYKNIQRVFDIAPLFITDEIKVNILVDDDEDATTIVAGEFNSSATLLDTELTSSTQTLKYRAKDEIIPLTNALVSNSINYPVIESKMLKVAYELGKDLLSNVYTILSTAGNFTVTTGETDLSNAWGTAGTAVPRTNIQTLLAQFHSFTNVDYGDSNVKLVLSPDMVGKILATTDYKNWVAALGTSGIGLDLTQLLQAYAGVRTVILPSGSTKIGVILYVQQPDDSFSISNINSNMSSIVTAAYNISNVNQPLEYSMTNGARITDSRAFIGARNYLREDGKAYVAQAFSWNLPFVLKSSLMVRFINPYS